MIDVNQLQKPQATIQVDACDRIFQELGNNTYDFKDLISELIDNSIAARRPDRRLKVSVEILVDQNNNPQGILIKDNALGIPTEMLGPAISPAGIQTPDSLNEHGLGMKQAVAALGKMEYIATKTPNDTMAKVIRGFKFGRVDVFLSEFDQDSGTEIYIAEPKPILNANPQAITMSLVPYLGARYRRFLVPDNKAIDIALSSRNTASDTGTYYWDVVEVKPTYFHPSTRTNKPVIFKKKLKGHGWHAQLTFGYAPTEDEYKELGIDKPPHYHPYNVSLAKQGLDVVLHDRVILFHQLSELGLAATRHPDYNLIRGEIDLLAGFATAITKNSIINDEHFIECIAAVKNTLVGQDEEDSRNYLRQPRYPTQIPEALLRDRLANWLPNNPLNKKKHVVTEYTVGGLAGNIDILADHEAWEIKRDQAAGLDVYQLFAYMDMADIQRGYLVAASFATGAQSARDFIQNKHKKHITIVQLKDFPINHPPSDDERTKYY